MKNTVCRGMVIGNRNVIYLCNAQQCFNVRVVRLSGKGVGKEYDNIYNTLCYLCTDLLVAAQRAAAVTIYLKAGCFTDSLGRRAGTAQ